MKYVRSNLGVAVIERYRAWLANQKMIVLMQVIKVEVQKKAITLALNVVMSGYMRLETVVKGGSRSMAIQT